MAGTGNRPRRVAEQIQRELASTLQKDVDDARLGWVTVSSVVASKDLAHATVYVTFLNNSITPKECVSVLQQNASQLRYKLGQVMRIRSVPHLKFAYDESIARGARMSSLINEAVTQDQQNATKREEK
ncbi:MAG: 30S ribosome-binding factor RbfA [Pseudomonadota bacterium]